MSFAWKGFHSFGGGFSPSFGPSLTGGITPIGSWDASTSTLAQLAALVSHSRTSLATMFDSTGKLTYAPNNLLTQSNTFSNAAWTKSSVTVTGGISDPLGGTAASTITATAGGGLLRQDITVSGAATTNGLVSVWARRRTGSGTVWLYKPDAVSTTVPALTGNWQQFSAAGVGAGSTFSFVVQFATNGDAIDIYAAGVSAVTWETLASQRPADQVITTSSAYYGPRIDYDPNTLAVKGLLIEEARTNLAINSTSLNSFSPSNITTTTNFAVAPDGTSAATKLDDGTTAAVPHQVAYSPSGLSASTAYAFSVFAKQGTGRYLTLSNVGSSSADGGYAVFDLQAGTVTQSAALGAGSLTSATITPINGGWYRLSVVAVAGTNTGRFLFVLGSNSGTYTADSNGRNSYTGTNNTWLVWGAQLELGSFATSYIPTAAASVTRAADVVQFTGAALTALQGSAGSAIVQTTGVATSAGRLLTASSNILLYYNGGPLQTFNGTSILTTASSPTSRALMRHGVAWSASGRSLAYTGSAVASDSAINASVSAAYLGSDAGTVFATGWYQSFGIWNQRLPDATLSAKLTVGASY